MSATGQYSVFVGNRGWTYGFTSMKAARTFVAAHVGHRYDIHKGAKLVESGKVHAATAGTGGRVWLVRNPSRRPMRGAFKGAERKRKTKTASYVGGKRSKSRGTHKYFREGFAAADRQEQEAMRERRERRGNPDTRPAQVACRICGGSEIMGKSTCASCGATGVQRTGGTKRNPKRTLVGHIQPKVGRGDYQAPLDRRRIAVYEEASGTLTAGGERYANMRDLLDHIDSRWKYVASNPLPVGKFVTVRAKRLPNGRVELRGMR